MDQVRTQEADGARTLAAIASCYMIGFLGMNFLPMWLGVLVGRLSISGARAGWIGTAELGAMAIASILISAVVGRMDRTRIAYGAVVMVACMNLLGAMTSNVTVLIVLRVLTGLGEGCLMALAAASVAATLKPERAMSVILIILNLLMALLFPVAPVTIKSWGASGLLGLMAGLTVVVMPFLRWLPRGAPSIRDPGHARSSALTNLPAIVALGSVVLLLVGHGMVFAFAERIGTARALSLQQIGSVLSVSMLIDCLAPLVVIALGLRLGRMIPICIGLSGLLIATLAITQSSYPPLFVLGVWVQLFAYTFVLPFFAGLLASLDRQGRVAAGMSGAIIMGFMLAPAVGGMLVVQSGGFRTMGWVAGGIYLLIIGLMTTGLFRGQLDAMEGAA